MRVRIAEPVLAVTLLVTSTAASAQVIRFDIPAGALGQALIALGEQAHITIGVTDPRIAAIRSRGMHGRMELRQALAKLLSGTGYTFVLQAGSVRIVRAAPSRADRSPGRSRPPAPSAADTSEIIITASKQDVRETQFGGAIHLIELNRSDLSRLGAQGSDAILAQLPVLASTHLGPGRDKLYVRGVADSSFNGPSQSLGGILKFVPNRPAFEASSGFVSAGGVATAHGGVGGDISATLNLRLANNVALRAVGYSASQPGYIDDLRLNRRDINRTEVSGGRAALRIDAGNSWDIEIGGVTQNTNGRDGQYALSTLPPLTRESNFSQPYDNDYRLASFTVRKKLPEIEFVSATG